MSNNTNKATIASIEVEKLTISGLLQFPHLYSEAACFLTESDFVFHCHAILFSIIKKRLEQSQSVSAILVLQEITNVGIKFSEIEDLNSYVLDGLQLISLNEKGFIDAVKELKKITIARDIDKSADKIKASVRQDLNKSVDVIISNCDKIYGGLVSSFESTDNPIDLFSTAQYYIEELGNKQNNPEIFSPYQNYQNMFGGYFPGDLVIFASAAKSGKSTLLLDLISKICTQNNNIRGLMLDTELETERVQRRMVASRADINEYFLKTGGWKKNQELIEKVRSVWPQIEKFKNKVDHKYIGNQSIDATISLIKHWYWKVVVPSKSRAIVCFDYFKLTQSDGAKDAFQSSMGLGYKVDALKKLASALKIPIIAACQTNRSNENRKDAKFRNESGSAVGLSYEINKFASSVFLFQRKFGDEIMEDGGKSTHKLIPLYTRDLGAHSTGYNDLVQTGDGWVENFIEYKLANFRVEEIGTLRDRMKAIGQLDIKDDKEDSDLTI